MKKHKSLLIAYKISFALLGLSALITEVVMLVTQDRFHFVNFISFFTVQTNIIAMIAFVVGAMMTYRKTRNHKVDLFRGASALYIATTGIVFSLLLSGLDPKLLTAVPWDNLVLHYIIPVAAVIDWLIDRPKKQITFKQSLIWLVYPLMYFVYSLVRGHFVNWYPYPFLNPATNGYLGIAVVAIGITVSVVVTGKLLAWSTRQR